MGVPNLAYDIQESGSSPVYLASGGKLRMVDLVRHTVDELPLGGNVLSVHNYREAKLVDDDREATYTRMAAVRLADKIVILDMTGQTVRTIPVPEALRDQDLALFNNIEGNTIFQTMVTGSHFPAEVYFVDAEGQIKDRKEIPLYRVTPQQQRWEAVSLAIAMPVPAIYGYAVFVGKPTSDVESADYAAALAKSLDAFGIPLAVLCILSLALAGWCFARQRRYAQPGALAWATFVLLTGPPGIAGYLLHRHWPVIERCGQCGAAVPRDRETCSTCAAEFPTPTLLGIEVYS